MFRMTVMSIRSPMTVANGRLVELCLGPRSSHGTAKSRMMKIVGTMTAPKEIRAYPGKNISICSYKKKNHSGLVTYVTVARSAVSVTGAGETY